MELISIITKTKTKTKTVANMKKGLQWALLVVLALVAYFLILGWEGVLDRIGRLLIIE